MTLNKSNWRLDPQEAPVAGMIATGIHRQILSVKLLGAAYDVRVSCETLASDLGRKLVTRSARMSALRAGNGVRVRDASHTFCVPLRGIWYEGVDRRTQQSSRGAPAGWIITRASVGSLIEISEVGPVNPCVKTLSPSPARSATVVPMRSRRRPRR